MTWRVNTGKKRLAGQKAGHQEPCGRYSIRIERKLYRMHRVIWLHVYGEWPENDVDHINGSSGDNRLSNLRAATKMQNRANSKTYKNNLTGLKGVHLHKGTGKYRAAIRCRGVSEHLGLYLTAEEAARVYMDRALVLFGEFATDGKRECVS